MEVVGVVAAIPELIKTANSTIGLVRDLSNTRKALTNITNGLETQLQGLTQVLDRLGPGRKSSPVTLDQLKKISPLIQQLREQLLSLNNALATAQSSSRVKRVELLLGGFKKKLKADVQKLETSIAMLNLSLVECSLKISEENAAAARLTKRALVRDALDPVEQNFIPLKLDTTLQWLPLHPAILRLLQDAGPSDQATTAPMSRLLAAHGPKGCGKSVLATSLAQHIRTTGAACAFFSFYHGIERQRKVASMLTNIAWQILHFEDLSDDVLLRIYDSIICASNITTTLLLGIIHDVIIVLKKSVYFIIDGIDESADDWNDTEGPFKTIREWLTNHPQLHILLVGRISALHVVLKLLSSENIIELSEDVTRDDVFKFIAHKLQESPNLASMPSELRLQVQHTLQEKSTGMFLWVELVFKELKNCYSVAAVQDCLQDLPRDLDDEYFRLFMRLMARLHASPGKPSSQTKAARTLLAFVVGSTELLSVDELRYAYAAFCAKGPKWEDHVLSAEAVLDFLGDLVVCTGEYVHFNHSSVEEFLVRPVDEWPHEKKEIEFFRLDRLECQQLIGSACLEYLTAIDFGYPIAEDSYCTLSDKPFLTYAIKHSLLHWAHLQLVEPQTRIEHVAKVKAFIEGPRSIGLFEYFILALLNNVEFTEDYGCGLPFFDDGLGDELLKATEVRLASETAHRLERFGPHDLRTRSLLTLRSLWSAMSPTATFQNADGQESSLECLWPTYLPSLELEAGSDHAGSSCNMSNTLSPSTSTNGRGQAIGQACQHNHRHFSCQAVAAAAMVQSNIPSAMLASSPLRALRMWVDPHVIRRKMTRAFVAKLPFSIHIFYIDHIMSTDKELGHSMIELGIERTAGQRNFNRACILLLRAFYLPDERSYFARKEADYVEAYEILSKAHDNLITRYLLRLNIHRLICLLASLDRRADLKRLLDQLVAQPITSAPSTTKPRRESFTDRFFQMDLFRRQELIELDYVNDSLHTAALFEDAHRIYEHSIQLQQARRRPDYIRLLDDQLYSGLMLMLTKNYTKAEEYFRKLLREHGHHKAAQENWRFPAFLFILAQAIYMQERYEDAIEFVQRARKHPCKEHNSYWRSKCTVFIAQCLKRLGKLEAAKGELETVSLEKAVRWFRKLDLLRFGELEDLWWNVVCGVYSCLGEPGKEVTARKLVQAGLDSYQQIGRCNRNNMWELSKALNKATAYSEAIDVSRELINRIEGPESTQMGKMKKEKWLMRAKLSLLRSLEQSEGYDSDKSLRRATLRSCMKHLDRLQASSAKPHLRADIAACCKISRAIHGWEHKLTLRFGEHLSLCLNGEWVVVAGEEKKPHLPCENWREYDSDLDDDDTDSKASESFWVRGTDDYSSSDYDED